MNIAIHIVCKAARQKNIEFGTWINAEQSVDAMLAEIQAFLKTSPIPDSKEFVIADYSGFYELELAPYTPLEKVVAMAAFVRKHQELGAKLLIRTKGDVQEAERLLKECFRGSYRTKEACVQDIFCSLNPVLHHPKYGASIARDIFQYACWFIRVEHLLYVFYKNPAAKTKMQSSEGIGDIPL